MRLPYPFDAQRVTRLRKVLWACERSAAGVARFAPPDAIEKYVRICARAERHERFADFGMQLISLFTPSLLTYAVGGVAGAYAGLLFFIAWIVFGLDQCATHTRRVRSATVAHACADLCEVADHRDAPALRTSVLHLMNGDF